MLIIHLDFFGVTLMMFMFHLASTEEASPPPGSVVAVVHISIEHWSSDLSEY